MSTLAVNLDAGMQLVNQRIEAILAGSNRMVTAYVASVGRSRGKRIRPRLMMALSSACGEAPLASVANCAACCELLHTASLIHDDVIDEADKRRGEATLNHRFGNEIAVVVGDYILALLLSSLNQERDFALVDMLINTSQELGLGVIREVNDRDNFALSADKYYEMIYLKTAALFCLACRMGAYLSGADASVQELAVRYGRQLGLAFQVVDDLLDLTQDAKLTGKPSFNDVREGRVTLPFIHACAEAPEETRALYVALQDGPDAQLEQQLREHLTQLGSLRYTYDQAQGLLAEARVAGERLCGLLAQPELDEELRRIEQQVLHALPAAAYSMAV